MIDPASDLVFLGASIALILVPGPAQALVVAGTLAGGPRQGALTAVGLNIGTLVHTLAAALGLSAVLATSSLAFAVVKWAGAAYLLYLGVRALRGAGRHHAPEGTAPTAPVRHAGTALRQGVLAGVLNPKVALFFLAFLPQFVDPARGAVVLQFLALGATMALLDTFYELLIVGLVWRARGRLLGSPRLQAWRDRVSGTVLVLLGLRLAMQER
ncbi:MAG TPA: LysE family translocator [Burkholderiaceae bacterium]|nr:LysE family translocator [Burkholderiaceae bacterium]